MKEKCRIILKSGKDEAVKRFHPWVFSGAIKKMSCDASEGEIVEVYSNKDEFLGLGHYQIGSIAVRICSFKQCETDEAFWKQKFEKALKYREIIGISQKTETNAYRLINAEGDGFPGLIVDYYNGTAVMQCHSVGMHLLSNTFANILSGLMGDKLKAVYSKSSETLPRMAKVKATDGYILGSRAENIILENNNQFYVDWETGQKTGFFLDQRENRRMLTEYSANKKVLNTFCYSGGFSVYALKGGASQVHSVDSSKKAIELTEKNLALNGYHTALNECIVFDAMEFLNTAEDHYDIIILDPPAFAKHNDVRHNAVQGYKRLNAAAIRLVRPGGIIFTFSCSQVVDRQLFNATVISAAIQAGRNVRIMHQLSQPPDHAFSTFHPEGQYLKGLVLFVE